MKGQAAALGLTLNKAKTSEHDLRTRKTTHFEYLGYKISFGDDPIRIGLSAKRKKKYEHRIKRSFDAYRRHAGHDEKKARRLLLKRVNFLTGNTRLVNNKGNIMTGVFYSNSLLSSAEELEDIDRELKAQTKKIKPVSLRNLLDNFSFKEGFSDRRYHAFSVQELARIVELWSHET